MKTIGPLSALLRVTTYRAGPTSKIFSFTIHRTPSSTPQELHERANPVQGGPWPCVQMRAQQVDQVLLGYYEIPETVEGPIDAVINPQGLQLRSRQRIWNLGAQGRSPCLLGCRGVTCAALVVVALRAAALPAPTLS